MGKHLESTKLVDQVEEHNLEGCNESCPYNRPSAFTIVNVQ